jgi:hypothetical protein
MSFSVQRASNIERPPWVEPDNCVRYSSARGEIAVWFPAPLVIVYRYTGYTDASHARFIERTFDDAFGPEQAHVHLFADTSGQTGYDPEFRKLTGARFFRIEPRTDTYCLLVKSRIIALGIQLVASVMKVPTSTGVTGRISAVSDRAVFQSRIEAAVRKSAELSPR